MTRIILGNEVASRFSLDGSMIPRQVKRLFDQRAEPRAEPDPGTGVLTFRGQDHVVQLIDQSPSGVRIAFPHVPNIGETLSIQLLQLGTRRAQVRWVRNGHVGLAFTTALR